MYVFFTEVAGLAMKSTCPFPLQRFCFANYQNHNTRWLLVTHRLSVRCLWIELGLDESPFSSRSTAMHIVSVITVHGSAPPPALLPVSSSQEGLVWQGLSLPVTRLKIYSTSKPIHEVSGPTERKFRVATWHLPSSPHRSASRRRPQFPRSTWSLCLFSLIYADLKITSHTPM